MGPLLQWLRLALLLLTLGTAQAAEPEAAERLQVAGPFLELHTGPGRGYPVFHVVERRQWITVELRHTDWFRVRDEGGKVGWVPRTQLATTLTEAGEAKPLAGLRVDDYLARRLEYGAAWGRFQSDPLLGAWVQARLADTLGVELGIAQVQGRFSSTELWRLSLTSEPWSDRRLSPFIALGLGQFKNLPNASLVDATPTDARLAHATLGLRWHIGQRFVARLDSTLYTAFVSDARSTEFRSVSAGLAFFF
ncbi:exported hypothetical protein [Rubrivivax sp. A210]|uniref:SH3 domain-containing protein n=1 Tax=Rubrivivax sp. A210 TaxID=2772301 RepID=UPI00191B0B96|nr:SH3 domain-containing protein [Rubrivivax sp. A210]CAD5374970.1 exported hypothetical protein [Rubrivivax sp. A210]